MAGVAEQAFEVKVEGGTIHVHLGEELFLLEDVPDGEIAVGIDEGQLGLALVSGQGADGHTVFHEHHREGVVQHHPMHLSIGQSYQ